MNTLPTHWRQPLLAGLLLFVLLLAGQWQAVSSMAQLWWRSETFTHALLVPPIAAWLVWRQRAQLASLRPAPWWPGLLVLLATVLVGQFGRLVEVNALQHFGVVFTLQALVLALYGRQLVRALAFPLAFLLFAPPFGEFLMQPMMVWTADFVVSALRASGIPVFREGLHFVIPSGNWSVEEACSGVRYLMASFMVGTLFAYLNFARLRDRLGFMAVALLVPIVANWLRGYLIVVLGHLSNNELATGADHLIYGWVFFGAIMAIMFWLGARWADAVHQPAPDATPALPTSAGPAKAPLALALLAAAMLVAPSLFIDRLRQVPAAAAELRLALPAPAAWQAVDGANQLWNPVFVGADSRQQLRWRAADGGELVMDLAFYATQREGAKAVSSVNVLVPSMDSRWTLQREATQAHWQESHWLLRDGRGTGQQFLVHRAYWVDGQWTASEREAKWLGLRQLLAGRGDAQAVLVLMSAEPDAEVRLDAFWRVFQTPLNERLRQLAAESHGHNPGR